MPEEASPTREVRVDEVLPPERPGQTGSNGTPEARARLIARIMDELFRIPGTKIRIGLDPLMGLLPFVGGLLSSLVSLSVVFEGMKAGMPALVLARMGLNVLFNQLLDSIPLVGDVASIFFRSNSRNSALIERWKSGDQHSVRRGSKAIVITLLILFLVMFASTAWLFIHVLAWVWHQIMG